MLIYFDIYIYSILFQHFSTFVASGVYLQDTSYNIYTQTKVKQHYIFFGDTVLEVAERKMWVMEINFLTFIVDFITFTST